MSEQESDTCKTCGGVKRIDWTISFEQCRPVEMRFDPASLASGNWRLCPGHSELAPNHDGKLDAQGKHEVSYWKDKLARQTWVCIEETDDLLDEPEHVQLTPTQALSLLAWLRQEEAELQRLAEEAS